MNIGGGVIVCGGMLTHVTFTGWDRHTELGELSGFLWSYRQGTIEIAVLCSATRTANDEDRYPNVAKAAEIMRVAKAAGQKTALHLCGRIAQEFLNSAATRPVSVCYPANISQMMNLADRVQVNVAEDFWQVDGPERYRAAATAAHALGRPVIIQSRDASAWPVVEHFWPGASRMVPFLFDRSAGAGIEMGECPDPPLGRLVGYAGGLGPSNVHAFLDRLRIMSRVRLDPPIWIDMETGIRESMAAHPGGPPQPSAGSDKVTPAPTYVSVAKCRQVMDAVRWALMPE